MSNSIVFRILVLGMFAGFGHFPHPVVTAVTKGESRVVCYYTNWSAYRQGPAKFLPDNINPYLCTHLIYAFGGLTSDSGIKPFDKYQDIDKGGYTKFNGLKTYNKGLKTLIAIGGWNEGSGRFSRLVADAESRKSFIKNSIRFIRQHHFDGLDLDWEYPAAREGGEPQDKKNYAIFIKELREAFEEESRGTGRTRLLLTIAVPAGIEWIQKGFDIPSINSNVDFFNLLTYDFHASTEPAANHHAPLKAKDGFSDYDYKSQLNIEYAINYYLDEGADASKLVVGLPTYGRSYTLFNPESTDIGAPASGPGTKGKYTKEPGYLAYYEICEGIKSGEWRVENDESDTQGPHAVRDDQWVGYDDTRIMAIKAKWVRDNKLGGIMFWSVDNDDFRGLCNGKAFPLIEAAKVAYYTGESPAKGNKNSNSRFATGSRKVTTSTTPVPPTTTTASSTRKKLTKKLSTPRPTRKRRVKPKVVTTQRSTTTTPTPVTSDPLRTPPPPTTPETSVDFECKDDGFFGHPKDCKKYFWCLDAPGLGLVAHHFTCPAGLFFNKNTDSCDYARNVPCKPGGTTTTTPAPTTSTTTTTTTTPPSPAEEEYEYYEDDEEEEEEQQPPKKAIPKKAGVNGGSTVGKSAQEIQDIRNLLKIIKKLGGVEELEKYLEDNPDVADEIQDYEEEDGDAEEVKPSTTTEKIIFTSQRNRFNSPKKSSSTATARPYTSILRDKAARPEASEVSSTQRSSVVPFRPKYITLSRGKEATEAVSNGPSSTQTSIVVRFSNEEKLIEETETTSSKPVTYVTSVPYSKVTDGQLGEASGEKTKPKYATFSRGKATTTPLPTPTSAKEEEIPADEEYEDEEYVEDEPVISSSTTTTTTTSTTTSKPIRIPSGRTRSPLKRVTTTSTTTTEVPPTKVTYRPTNNFSPANRRNPLFERRKVTSTPNQTNGNEESSTAGSSLVANQNRRITPQPSSTASPETATRFRSRFRTSTTDVTTEPFDNFLKEKKGGIGTTSTLSPLASSFQSAVIRRRTRKPPSTTAAPPTRTTVKPPSSSSIVPPMNRLVPIADSPDYYYYVYEDEEDLLDKSQSQFPPSPHQKQTPAAVLSRRSLDLGSEPPSSPSVPVRSRKIRLLGNGQVECGDKGVYPHPASCGRSYVRCVQNESGVGLKAWIYSCPSSLSFDPIGGICNWPTTNPHLKDSNDPTSSTDVNCSEII